MATPSTDRNVRRRLEQFVANTACEANVLSAAHGIPMADVVRAENGDAGGGQSGFAIARGVQFERTLYDDSASVLRDALARAGVLAESSVEVVDLRLRAHGGPMPTLDAAATAFRRLLAERADDNARDALVIAPAMQLAGGGFLPDGMFAIDVLAIHAGERTVLRVGEIKVYPDRGGHTDTAQLATARAQAGLYVHVLRTTLRALGLEARLIVADDGFLVLSSPRAGRPSVRAGEDLRWQARRAATMLDRLRNAAERVLPPASEDGASPAARIAVVGDAPIAYEAGCIAFCSRARLCRTRAQAAGDPAVLGPDVVRLLGPVRLGRALELLTGTGTARDSIEHDLVRRLGAAASPHQR